MEAIFDSNILAYKENGFRDSRKQWKLANANNLRPHKIEGWTTAKRMYTGESTALNRIDYIEKQIEEAEQFIRSKEYLMDGGVDEVQSEAFQNAIKFLRNYSSDILHRYGVIIRAPYIDVLKDGSISVDWECGDTKFLIIFKDRNRLAYFYGERDDKIPFKGAIEGNNKVDESLAVWMKEYLG